MTSVVEADGKNLNRSQGSEKFCDFGLFSSRLKAFKQVAFQEKGGAVRLQFRMGEPALAIEMANDFHRSGVRWGRLKVCTVEDLNL